MNAKYSFLAFAVIAACNSDPDRSQVPHGPPAAAPPDASAVDAIECASPLAMCGATCVDLQNDDAANCGECGRSCRGASCRSGMCGTTVLAQGQVWPLDIAVDA